MNSNQTLIVLIVVIIGAIAVAAVWWMSGDEPEEEGNLSVVATFYPLGYMAEEIGGPDVEVTVLVPENAELHGWEPSPSDIVAADNADVLVYNGAGIDEWFEHDVLETIEVGDAIVVETVHEVELIDAEDHHEEEENGHEEEENGHEEEENGHEEEENGHDHEGADPHTWMSPWNAILQGEEIYDALVEADPANEDGYTKRWSDLKATFTDLDERYSAALNETDHETIIVSHEAYGYLAHRYGFEQHGVIGLSADEQPSASTIATLVEEMVEHGIYTVFVDPVYSDEYARTLKTEVEDETGEDVDVLDLYLMTGEMDGLDMVEQMEKNLINLKTGLGAGD